MTSSEQEDALNMYKKLVNNYEFLQEELQERETSGNVLKLSLLMAERDLQMIEESSRKLAEEASNTLDEIQRLKGELAHGS